MSRQADVNNVLLRITVPKRTGRKRKRGSNGAFLSEEELDRSAVTSMQKNSSPISAKTTQLIRTLKDNKHKQLFSAVGTVTETHRFRSIPDIQYASSTDPLMTHLKETILSSSYTKVQQFNFDERPNLEGNIGIPPVWCQVEMPFNYGYQQNSLVKFTTDSNGKPVAINTNRAFQTRIHHVAVDAPTVPPGPHKDAIPESKLRKNHRTMITRLRKLMEIRPILTRRFMLNTLQITSQDDLRNSLQYCGYHFVTGPWKDSLVKFGLDPRSSPEYRQYQTVGFQAQFAARYEVPTEWMDQRTIQHSYNEAPQDKPTSHTFDGTTVIPDGKVWQLCDITDPQIRYVIDTDDLRPQCDVRIDGWYKNGSMAKIRGIMKHKLEQIRKGEVPEPLLYERALAFPNEYFKSGIDRTIYDALGPYTPQDSRLLATIRTLARETWIGNRRKLVAGQAEVDDVDDAQMQDEVAEEDEDQTMDDLRDLEEENEEEDIEVGVQREGQRRIEEEDDLEGEDSFFEDEDEAEEEAAGDDGE